MPNLNNTIVLRGDQIKYHEERIAAAGFYPGHVLMLTSANKVQKHNVLGGAGVFGFAKEDYLQGKTVDQAYATDELALIHQPQKADRIYARVAAGHPAIVKGDRLMSAGDGTVMLLAGLGENLYTNAAASAAVSDTVTVTAFDKSYTVPANTLKVGDILRIKTQGIATSTNSTDTLTIKVLVGSTEITTTGAVDVANNDIFYTEVDLIIRTIGASGTFVAAGLVGLGAAGTVTGKAVYKASTAIDTTTSKAVTVTAGWSVASSSNSVRLDVLEVGILRNSASTGTVTGNVAILGVADEAIDNSAGVTEEWVKLIQA